MANVRADLPFLLIGGFLDEKQHFETIEAMKNFPEYYLGSSYFCINDEDGGFYVYSSTNEINTDTGKWRKFEGGEFNGFEEWKPDTEYKVDDYVTYDSCLWICTENHISSAEFVGEIENITTTNYILKDSDGLILKDSSNLLIKDTVKTSETNSYWRLVIGIPTKSLEEIFLSEEEMTLLLDDIFGGSS